MLYYYIVYFRSLRLTTNEEASFYSLCMFNAACATINDISYPFCTGCMAVHGCYFCTLTALKEVYIASYITPIYIKKEMKNYSLHLFLYHKYNLQCSIKCFGDMYANVDNVELDCSTTWVLITLLWIISKVVSTAASYQNNRLLLCPMCYIHG